MDFCKIDDRAITPTRAHADDAGLDVYALEDVVLRPGEIKTISTGLRIALPPHKSGLLWPKSGLAQKGLVVLGGCIDNGYRGELKVVVQNGNIEGMLFGLYWREIGADVDMVGRVARATIAIPYGKPLTQLLIADLSFDSVNEVDRETFEAEATDRGEGGFGSTSKEGGR